MCLQWQETSDARPKKRCLYDRVKYFYTKCYFLWLLHVQRPVYKIKQKKTYGHFFLIVSLITRRRTCSSSHSDILNFKKNIQTMLRYYLLRQLWTDVDVFFCCKGGISTVVPFNFEETSKNVKLENESKLILFNFCFSYY